MIKAYKNYFNLIFLFVFLFVSLFINFFHTEKTLSESDDCFACNFLNSSLTTTQINFFFLPPPSILSIVESSESFNYTYIFFIDPTSRSPPQI